MADIQGIVRKLQAGYISGNALSSMMQRGELTKTERRKITRIVQHQKKKETKDSELTERQKLRRETKEKKALPKMSKEERRQRFSKDMETEHEKKAANFTICLGCRKRGHFVKDCPNRALATAAPKAKEGPVLCFNCGSLEHTLKDCPEQRDPSGHLPYAKCFICRQSGHIARDCPENANGLYPQGGCCHICLQKTHLARDCPDRTEEDKEAARRRRQEIEDAEKGPRVRGLTKEEGGSGDGDDFITFETNADEDEASGDESNKQKKQKKRKAKGTSAEKPKKAKKVK